MTNRTFLKTASCAAIAAMIAFSPVEPAGAQQAAAQSYADAGHQLVGPKKSVAVIDFGATGAFLSQYGGWDAGGGLAAMLETELQQTGRFRLANRSHLDAALYEQQLSAGGLTAGTAAQPAQLVGAQFLIRGTVTDFTLAQKGGGFSIGGNLGGGVVGGIGPRSRTGRVAIDFQVMDSTTGEVVDAFSVSKKIKSRSIAVSASRDGVNVSGNRFENTPLGEAAREAIAEASARVANSLDGQDWAAHVAQVRQDTLYVNVGADGGLRAGDTLKIFRIVDQINDPVTGAILGMERAEIGRATITSVADQYARADYASMIAPEAGDILTYAPTAIAQLSGAQLGSAQLGGAGTE